MWEQPLCPLLSKYSVTIASGCLGQPSTWECSKQQTRKDISSRAHRRQAVNCPSKAEFEAVFIFSVLGWQSASVHVTGQILVHICRFPQHAQSDKSLWYSENIIVIIC